MFRAIHSSQVARARDASQHDLLTDLPDLSVHQTETLHGISVAGDFGTKITALVKRLKWLGRRAPEEKALVFRLGFYRREAVWADDSYIVRVRVHVVSCIIRSYTWYILYNMYHMYRAYDVNVHKMCTQHVYVCMCINIYIARARTITHGHQ